MDFNTATATKERNIFINVQDAGVDKITIYAYQQSKSRIGWVLDAVELFVDAGKESDEVDEENNKKYRIYDNSVCRQIYAGTGCNGTLISYGDEHLICNQHFDQKQLALELEYYTPVAYETYHDAILDRCDSIDNVSVNELGDVCQEILGGY